MSFVHTVTNDELRVVLCIALDRHAPPQELAALKASLIQSESSLHSVETTGSFDFISEIVAPDMASYRSWLETVAEPLAKLAVNVETSFVCKRFIRCREGESAIWVRYQGGVRRIDCAMIDKVKSEGNYVNIHSGGRAWMVHRTLHSMLDCLGSKDFVQLHRSSIVRCAFITRMIHEGRHWVAELNDGTRERVGHSHVSTTLSALLSHPAMFQPHSSNDEPTIAQSEHVQRKVNEPAGHS